VHVHKAIDTQTGNPIILRSFQVEDDDDMDAFLRFQQEGALLSTLRHPNIYRVMATFLEGHTGYMAMEFVEGRPLSQILAAERLEPARIKFIAQQVASALAYSHSKNMVHRDISPENIVVIADDAVKVRALTELGMARLMKSGITDGTSRSLTLGKPAYLSPEQITERPSDGRSDVYSLGAVLYHMATGHPPFAGKDTIAVARQVVNTMPVRPTTYDPQLPSDWEAILLRSMAKDPEQRFPTMKAMERAIAALSVPAAASTTPPIPTQDLETCPRCGKEGRGQFCSSCGTRLRRPT
jgi:serine/threonine protein kinase